MDSQFFNRKRFIALCRWDWTERQKALGLQAVVIYAVLTVFSGFYTIRGAPRQCPQPLRQSPTCGRMESHIGRPRPRRGRKLDFRECPVFPDSCLLPCRHCTPDTKGIAGHVPSCPYTYLPVSAFEQFLLRWLYAVPLALLTYCAVFVAADFTRVGLCSLIVPQVDYAHLLPYADYWNGRVHPYWLLTLLNLMLLGAVRFHLHLRNETGKRAHSRPPARHPRAFRPRTFALRPGRSLQPLAHPPVIVNAFFLLCTVLNWYMAYRHILKTDLTYVKSAKH